MKTINPTILFLSALFLMLSYGPRVSAQDLPPIDDPDYQHCILYQSFDDDIGTWQRRTDHNGVYVVDGMINGVDITPGNGSPGTSGLPGDHALEAFDTAGSDVIFSQEYLWQLNLPGVGNCLCFDFKVIDDRRADVKPSIGFYIGDLHNTNHPYSDFSDPNNVIDLLAYWQADQVVKEGDGWVRVCAPLELSENGELPSGWMLLDPYETATSADFDDIMTNPSGIMFYIDYIDDPNEKYLIDNVCLGDCTPPSNGGDDGAFCGDPEDNLLENGNFESGDTGFDSDYDSNPMTLPGQYTVSSSANAFGMEVQDHSSCEDSSAYPDNDSFLLVNGLTNQPDGASSVVYSQDMELTEDKEYKLCVNLKDLPNCNFNIHPEIQIEIGEQTIVPYFDIVSDPTDPCDWMFVSECFIAEDTGPLKIRLKEDVLGDGNDFAMDDVSLFEMESLNIDLSVTHTSDNTISATIDPEMLPNEECQELGDEDHYWFVFQTDTPMNPTNNINDFAWSDGSGSYGAGANGTVWNLPTTNFPEYTFQDNKFYVAGMYVPGCCDSGFTDGWAYQITFKSTSGRPTTTMSEFELNNQAKQEIISRFVKSRDRKHEAVKLYPNPSRGNINVSIIDKGIISGKIEVFDLNGRKIHEGNYQNFNNEIQLNLSPKNSGLYLLKLTDKNNKVITKEILIRK